jgi:hypothetical protein
VTETPNQQQQQGSNGLAARRQLAWEADMIRLQAARIQRTVAIVAMVLVATALCWLSWRAGSPLWDRLKTEATRQAVMLSRLQFPGNAPKAGPAQRIGMP